ncbi:DNA-3-methyladenine glycosylase [Peptoniphilus sp. oral taxon 386]|uniref:DNA-3-methyladenine glycosylase n=1 Tax=Peptoniphilus sp. oral taxon 386 TaxID=652713 RepID=UPI0001DA9CB2|nr:DNA-3-methyladenine glycosylase [Peptoniphilus sp. oral taxon 386]EFI42645.1 DNA-3-methyladenine glycosylase [Peptoniphilus sp. oral taxon 386 str. F0131]
MKLNRNFYNRDTDKVARELLGKILVRKYNGVTLEAKIVETEAYLGFDDRASHTFNGRRTLRNEVMYGRAGHLYVYFTYGMYNLVNVVTNKVGLGEAVLIRAVEPVKNIDEFSKNRFGKNFEELSNYQKKNLTNGPGKLTIAMKIDRNDYGKDLLGNEIYIKDGYNFDFKTINSKRIGIDYAMEAKDFLLRYYIEDNEFVSVK